MDAENNAALDIQEALIAWQGGELPSGLADELLAKLRKDAEFRRAFAQEVWTLSLTRIAQAPDPRWLALYEELQLSTPASSALSDDAFTGSVMKSIRALPVRFVSAWWRYAALGATATALTLAVGFAWSTLRAPVQQSITEAKRQTLAILVQSDEAVWADKRQRSAPGSILASERLRLSSGRVSIMFTNGVTLNMEGPADLELLAVDRVICREGQLRTKVPKGAEGFSVETPRGVVTDLGTEFGVSIGPDGTTRVAVFEGQTEVSVPIPGQAGVRTALVNKSEAVELQATGEIRSNNQEAFLAGSTIQFPELLLPPQYAETVLAAKPLLYWRLNRTQEDGLTPNEVVGAPALRLHGEATIERDGFGRMSAVFHGVGAPGILHLDRPWRTPGENLAVEMWFAPASFEEMTLFSLAARKERFHLLSLIDIGSRRDASDTSPGTMRYLLRWPTGRRDGVNLFSPPVAVPYRWHHVVVQHHGGDMEMFLDGKLVGSAHTDLTPEAALCVMQFGCLEFRPGDELAKLNRLFSGRMAEIALYDRLLTPEEIHTRATLGGLR